MNIKILKFGGTSVTSKEKRENIKEIIKETLEKNFFPVVVVSAMGRYPDNYATDTLLDLLSDDYKNNNKQGTDLLMSCGEIISACNISSYLNENCLNTIPLTGGQAGIITDENFGNANVLEYNKTLITNLINENKIPIIAGFQGVSKHGFITTLGRGGSDTSAAILGDMLDAKEVIIYTDVDGLYDKDPKEKDANFIKNISFNDAYNLAINGAKVIHPNAIKYAMKKHIPIIIKNIMKNNEGTKIED